MTGRRKRSDGSRATLRDVALRAGVSTATVSRAINAPATVSAPLRDRIAAARAALAFVPDQSARSLSSRHSRLVGVLAPTLDDPGWAACIGGLQARLEAAGYAVLLALTGGDAEREASATYAMACRAVEAVVAVGRIPGDHARARLLARAIPVVDVDADDTTTDGSAGGGWRRAGRVLGQYLVGLGHAHVAWVAGEGAATWRAAAVRAGLTDALVAAKLAPPVLLDGSPGPALTAGLARAAPPSTALVCADDTLALAVMQALAAAGVGVPGLVSVVGCGDAPAARQAHPSLTTLRRPYAAAGAATADRVLAQLRGAPVPPEMQHAKLVVRCSTGPAGSSAGGPRPR